MSKLQALMEAQRKAKESANVGRTEDSGDKSGPVTEQQSESAGGLVQLPVVPSAPSGSGTGGTGFKPRLTSTVGAPSGGGFKPKSSVATPANSTAEESGENRLPARTNVGSSSGSAAGNVLSLADLDSLSESTELTTTGVATYLFADREKVTAPDRVYDEELTESQASFVELLNGIYDVLDDPEAFGSMIRTIMLELQENGEYRRLLADEDVNAMMRGLRDSMGMARIKKTEKTKGKSSTPTNKKVEQISNMMADLGFADDAFDD